MNKMILAAVVSMAATTAFAKATTEYYFQPAAGAHAVKVNYVMTADPGKAETGGGDVDVKQTNNDLYLDYGYGLNETTTLGAYTFSGSSKTTIGTTDTTANGMGDIHLYYKGFADMIHWGVDLGVNMGKAKADKRGTGGLSIAANVGVLANSAEWNYGGDLMIILPQERTTENTTGADSKTKGGNTTKLAGFAEYNYGMGFVGGELAYVMVADTDTGAAAKRKGEGYLMLTGNVSYDFNDMATGLLSIGVENHSARDEDDSANPTKLKAYMGTNVALGVRLNF